MSAWWQFRALIRKNLLTMKRSIFMTLMEIFYPIILMLICYLIKLAFNSTKVTWEDEGSLDEYLIDKGNFGFDYNVYYPLQAFTKFYKLGELGEYPNLDFPKFFSIMKITDIDTQNILTSKIENIFTKLSPSEGVWKYIDPLEETHDISVSTIAGLPVKPLTMICYNRFTIALVGFNEDHELAKIIKDYIGVEMVALERQYHYKHFDSIDELNSYVTSEGYGKPDKPSICFGIFFEEKGEGKYKASLHYFNDFISHGIEDVPNNLKPVNELMQQGPNMNDIKKYSDDGYIQFMNILANYMLQKKILYLI